MLPFAHIPSELDLGEQGQNALPSPGRSTDTHWVLQTLLLSDSSKVSLLRPLSNVFCPTLDPARFTQALHLTLCDTSQPWHELHKFPTGS